MRETVAKKERGRKRDRDRERVISSDTSQSLLEAASEPHGTAALKTSENVGKRRRLGNLEHLVKSVGKGAMRLNLTINLRDRFEEQIFRINASRPVVSPSHHNRTLHMITPGTNAIVSL